MSSGQRKRPGGAAESGPARKRSRLQRSTTAGTSQTERAELVESRTPALEPDLSSQSSVPEVIVILNDDESPLDREQSQQLQYLSGASENSDEQQARDAEEGLREDDGDWLLYDFDLPYWSDEESEDREQNLQHSHPCRSAENSVGPLAIHDNEETRDSDGTWPAVPASSPVSEDEDSDVQDREQSQLYPLGSRDTEDSAELWASDNEEETIDNNSEWPDRFESPPTWQDDITDDWEESQQPPLGSRSAENSLVLASNLLEEPRDIEFEWPGGFVSPPSWEDENAQVRMHMLLFLICGCGRDRRGAA
ncbi:uncharacterized protein LOC130252238 isoform X2 [Oenanthe melanoleuca]|uniref:uncharacterized protein LOC130252238 isoform X2 n=1 Tax=Oenanthe melanoleuca TaxID=2939378 RepID=UPI0024C137B9|nr:uncharacterized protein LOC130252238 isoform X2 [Oenanthe melanoleuca]